MKKLSLTSCTVSTKHGVLVLLISCLVRFVFVNPRNFTEVCFYLSLLCLRQQWRNFLCSLTPGASNKNGRSWLKSRTLKKKVYWIFLYLFQLVKICWAQKIKCFRLKYLFCRPLDSVQGGRTPRPHTSCTHIQQYCLLPWHIKVEQILLTLVDTVCCPYVEFYVTWQNFFTRV